MKAAALLGLWRDRWAKPPVSALFLPYRESPLSQQLQAFATAALWRHRGWRWGARLLACLGLLTLAFMPLTVNAQIVFSVIVLATLVYLRRFGGAVLALGIACVSTVISLRYLGWRVQSTLVPGHSWAAFAWGMAWWSAEALAWCAATLQLLEQFWPARRPPQALPPQPLQWPCVDAIVWAEDPTLSGVPAQVQALRRQDWPAHRLSVQVVCTQPPSTEAWAWAQAQDVALVHYPASAAAPWGQLNRLLWDLEGELVLVVHAGMAPVPPRFLQDCMGWLQSDAALALLHTPTHPLTGPPSRIAQQLQQGCDPGAQLAVWRRQALNDIAGVELEHPGGTLARLRRHGWESAHLLVQTHPAAPQEQTLARVDRPFPAYGLRARLALQDLAQALHFYHPVCQAIFACTPLVALLALGEDQLPLEAGLLALGAFYLPHWIMASLARAAAEPQGRLAFSLLLREHLLPLHLAVRTTQSFLATQWRHSWQRLRGHAPPRDPALPTALWLRQWAWAGANGWAALQGLRMLQHNPHAAYGSALGVLVAWSLWNLLQAICRLAIEKEARLVESTRRTRQRMQAMVQTPGQRPLPCHTTNFPSESLVLHLRQAPAGVRVGQTLAFSLFHGYHEYAFDARLGAIGPESLQLQVAPSCLEAYRTLAQAVFSRDAQWPRWLPGREADHLLPARVRAVLHALETAFYNLVVQASKPPLIQLLKQWLQPGTKNNG